jgi:acyl carrier protein
MTGVSEEKLLKLISQVSHRPVEAIKSTMSFRGDLRMDSLQSLDLLVLIEEECGFVIPQNEAAKIQTVQNLFDHTKK